MNARHILLITFSLISHIPNMLADDQLISRLTITKNRCEVIAHASLSYLIHENFFVEYLNPDIDLRTMDISIVTIPFIMNISPIIWASGKTYSLESMDEDLYYSLKKIKQIFKRFYPYNHWQGKIKPEKLIKHLPTNPTSNAPELGVLFSGGLDAVCSSIRHQTRKQLLITVWGSDVHPANKSLWYGVKSHCAHYATHYGHEHTTVKSNICHFYKGSHLMLYNMAKKRIRWWPNTLQGLGYTSLAMPLLYARGCTNLIIGSTRTHDHPMPYGTHPLIDNNIHCASIQVFHDGAKYDRIEKIDSIIKNCTKLRISMPALRVCWGYHHLGGNCCSCEKCIRTIVELIAIGQDYFKWGFPINITEVIHHTQETLNTYQRLSKGLQWHWRCIQRYLHAHPHNVYASKLPRYHLEQLKKLILQTSMPEPVLEPTIAHAHKEFATAWKESTEDNYQLLKERVYHS